MKILKQSRCVMDLDSRWMDLSSICMGIGFFLRIVYYFAFTDISALAAGELMMQVILPLVCGGAFLFMAKGRLLNSPVAMGIVIAVYSLLSLLQTGITSENWLWAILLIVTTAAYLLTALGFLPTKFIVSGFGLAMAVCRLILVDLSRYILPLGELKLIPYLPEASVLFASLAIGLACPALKLTARRTGSNLAQV